MPLLVITGGPSSGKTTVACRIASDLKRRGVANVEVISDYKDIAFQRKDAADSSKEKEYRSALRSEIQKRLSKSACIIVDSLNYIKGYRYELFCQAKLVQTTYAVVYINADISTSLWLNSLRDDTERYDEQQIHTLFQQFEHPDDSKRWDSPLFTVNIGLGEEATHLENDELNKNQEKSANTYASPLSVLLPYDEIYNCLIEGKALKQNLSTQKDSILDEDYLHVLDRTTRKVMASIIEQQQCAVFGDRLTVPFVCDANEKVLYRRLRSTAELSRLRRQFITYTKMHPVKGQEKIASLFVEFLNSNE
ncbi:hypothetical protein AB6A40_001430 [Gnathostoma spinigerum]|uniref:Protein KTI12 homolog n=1 Tax=Gnathostoma spinigerum TaxID=75299 RepID=A0ABD6E5F2_9BILA